VAGTPAVAARPVGAAAVRLPGRVYVVRRGDTLSGIAVRVGTAWPALWALNRDRVADPDLIYPGQRLRV
jgi:resuscitation-promoting factor RpfA